MSEYFSVRYVYANGTVEVSEAVVCDEPYPNLLDELPEGCVNMSLFVQTTSGSWKEIGKRWAIEFEAEPDDEE